MDADHPKMRVDLACRFTDIMGFRDNAYRSVITGSMAPVHHTPWKEALDDSLESYLKN